MGTETVCPAAEVRFMKTTKLHFPTFIFIVLAAVPFGIFAQGTGSSESETTSQDLDRLRVAAVAKAETSKFEFSDAEIGVFEKIAFDLINARRSELGYTKMAWSEDGSKIARLHSTNMATLKFFGHAGADGKMVDERADQLNVKRWRAIGENIAFMRGYADPVKTAVEKWMLSTGHRANLLNSRWTESAVGIAVSSDGTFYFTQVFLERR